MKEGQCADLHLGGVNRQVTTRFRYESSVGTVSQHTCIPRRLHQSWISILPFPSPPPVDGQLSDGATDRKSCLEWKT